METTPAAFEIHSKRLSLLFEFFAQECPPGRCDIGHTLMADTELLDSTADLKRHAKRSKGEPAKEHEWQIETSPGLSHGLPLAGVEREEIQLAITKDSSTSR